MKKRESNLELLRIICMLMIIGSHYVQHSLTNSFDIMYSTFSINHIWAILFGIWGQLGVIGFITISCYFASNNIKSKKVFSLVFKIFIYCVILGAIGFLMNELSFKDFINELITPLYQQYWFITTYIFFIMLIPFIKIFTDSISKQTKKKLCIVLTILIPIYNVIWENVAGYLADFIYIYFIISYLKECDRNVFEKNAKSGFAITTILIICISLLMNLIATELDISVLFRQTVRITTTRNIFIIIDALFMFYMFKNMKMKYSKIINIFGKSTFGVYILHENILFKKGKNSLLWNRILKVPYYWQTSIFPLHMLSSIILVFIVCSIIDIILSKMIDEYLLAKIKIIDRLCNKFDEWYNPKQDNYMYHIKR